MVYSVIGSAGNAKELMANANAARVELMDNGRIYMFISQDGIKR